MNLKVPGTILPLGCAILNTRAKTVRGVGTTPPLGELGLSTVSPPNSVPIGLYSKLKSRILFKFKSEKLGYHLKTYIFAPLIFSRLVSIL